MKFLKRTFAVVASALGIASASRSSAAPEFTDGSRVMIEPAHISVKPEGVWGLMRTNLEQKDTDPQICTPTLMRREGQIYALLNPKSDLSLADQAGQFLKRQEVEDLKIEEIVAASGLKVVRAMAKKKVPQKDDRATVVFHFVLNANGRLAVVYYLGKPNLADGFATWFAATVKNEA